MTESPSAAASPRSLGFGGVISLATGFLALAGGVAYAIMRYSYQEYYNVFGLTPDDVGPNSAAALTQSGIGVATFVVLFAIVPVALALLGVSAVDTVVRYVGEPRQQPPSRAQAFTLGRSRLLARLGLDVVVALGIYRAFTALTHGHWEPKQLAVLGVAVGLLTLRRAADDVPAPTAPSRGGPADEAAAAASADPGDGDGAAGVAASRAAPALVLRAARRLPPRRLIVVALMSVIAALVLGGSLPGDARATAGCASDRLQPVRFVHTHRTFPLLDHIGVLRVRADPAELAWIGSSPKSTLPNRPLLYLGESGGRYFVYSTTKRQTVQIPEGTVTLSTIPRPHCHYWQPLPLASR